VAGDAVASMLAAGAASHDMHTSNVPTARRGPIWDL
jgi:hypothetical protein